MDNQNTLLIGKILGELYRLQRAVKLPCSASDSRIYGLLNGFEDDIKDELDAIGFVSTEQYKHVADVLEPIWDDPNSHAKFEGFYDVESEIKKGGIDRTTARKILKHMRANHAFTSLIEKMDSSRSPGECRTFVLDQYDK